MDDEKLSYEDAMKAVQSGVAWDQSSGSEDGSPKHLRVGIASAHVTDAGLAALLIAKGVITGDEYAEAVRVAAINEKRRYERLLSEKFGKEIRLGSPG